MLDMAVDQRVSVRGLRGRRPYRHRSNRPRNLCAPRRRATGDAAQRRSRRALQPCADHRFVRSVRLFE